MVLTVPKWFLGWFGRPAMTFVHELVEFGLVFGVAQLFQEIPEFVPFVFQALQGFLVVGVKCRYAAAGETPTARVTSAEVKPAGSNFSISSNAARTSASLRFPW